MAISGVDLIAHVRTDTPSAQVSCYSALVREARTASCRAAATGELQVASDEERAERGLVWTGVMLYLTLIEHVGWYLSGATRAARPRGAERAFERTLEMFGPSMPGKERKALRVLRNSFAHDFSLARERHHFRLSWTLGSMPAVTLPPTLWDGSFSNSANPTKVNLRAVEDLAESVVGEIWRLANAQPQRLHVVAGITDEEFDCRFRFRVSRPPSAGSSPLTSTSNITAPGSGAF
jgi:hypothetical protein